MIAADTITDEQIRELLALLADWDWPSLANSARHVGAPPDCVDAFNALARIANLPTDTPSVRESCLREGFEIAVGGAEVCHEESCTHDHYESHINWSTARVELENEILNARAKEAK